MSYRRAPLVPGQSYRLQEKDYKAFARYLKRNKKTSTEVLRGYILRLLKREEAKKKRVKRKK